MSKILAIAALFTLLIHAAAGAEQQPKRPDNAELLTLPWKQFDQTLGSGWRIYACREEHGAAAELIETYLARRTDLTPTQRAVSHFHAAVELARENRHQEALRHLEKAEVAAGSRGVPEDWNELVISTRAFLLADREALLASKRRVERCALPHIRTRLSDTSSTSVNAMAFGTKSRRRISRQASKAGVQVVEPSSRRNVVPELPVIHLCFVRER